MIVSACLQLREHGVRVLTVREILAYNVEENISARVDLEDLAFCALDYTVSMHGQALHVVQ